MAPAGSTPSLFDEIEPEEMSPAKKPKAEKAQKKSARAVEPEEETLAFEEGEPEADAPPAKADGGRDDTRAKQRVSAEDMAGRQREISVAEFFTKNRHLLGFDSPLKALLTAVKEAVDNSLDACEEAGILPEITVEIRPTASGENQNRFRMIVEDNGPGIVEAQLGKVFGQLLYGSKFHKLSQSRGQQGIGISAAGMYGQLTTGKPVRIVSKTGKKKPAIELEIVLDTARNRPDIVSRAEFAWEAEHGTRVEIEMEAKYQKGMRSVDMYLKQTAIANPHLTLHYVDPGGEKVDYERSTKQLPKAVVEIKPHPHGVELGRLIQMLQTTSCRSLSGFLQEEFSRVGSKVAHDIIDAAGRGLSEKSYPTRIAREEASALHEAIQKTKISSPSTDCIAPIGEELVLAGLKKEIEADFYTAITRPAAVYRGNPFQIEVGIAYGKPGGVGLELNEEGRITKRKKDSEASEALVADADEPIRLLRYANRVPLLYQQAGCAITKALIQTNWRSYGLQQPKGSIPIGACAVMVHIASVWVPFTSESKEAIANYPEIQKELRLGLMEAGRRLGTYIRKGQRLRKEFDKRSYIEKYIPHIGIALQEILDLSVPERDGTVKTLEDVLHKSRKF
ncbi:MAG: DNA topoisomerase VI subunit B [Planctomycetes bacterium]|nr:DNA topoisomerase VI subunit B [Planctomycetota bacterium]